MKSKNIMGIKIHRNSGDMKHKIICGNCLEIMVAIPKKSVDLVVMDPPYNINKAEWDRIPNYVEWIGKVFLECQRVLKDSGSFYFFHNEFMRIVELQQWISDNTDFVFKQLLVWNKRFTNARNKGYLDGFVEVNGLRNYQQMAEYILYYTFQDETGLNSIIFDSECFKSIKEYFYREKLKSGLTNKQINKILGTAINGSGMAGHYFKLNKKEWYLPTKEKYKKLQTTKHFQQSYESLREEYESLREEYESLRYTFNNQKIHHSVWNYEIEVKQGHITPKPIVLIENIIKHSSNEGDTVLDPMCGSGTTLVAAERLGRNSIGIDNKKEFCELSYERLLSEVNQVKIDREPSEVEKIGF